MAERPQKRQRRDMALASINFKQFENKAQLDRMDQEDRESFAPHLEFMRHDPATLIQYPPPPDMGDAQFAMMARTDLGVPMQPKVHLGGRPAIQGRRGL